MIVFVRRKYDICNDIKFVVKQFLVKPNHISKNLISFFQ
ncbi:hypothetical protein EZS27_007446 [termite gut metagenome]|uniref:Uncharacterized protein n=1 Tax=termite gut metagenome TaxID=433724 RepID=A0A5J4SFX7_9ZZZZ